MRSDRVLFLSRNASSPLVQSSSQIDVLCIHSLTLRWNEPLRQFWAIYLTEKRYIPQREVSPVVRSLLAYGENYYGPAYLLP